MYFSPIVLKRFLWVGRENCIFFFKVYKSSISLCEITGVMVSVLLLPSSPATTNFFTNFYETCSDKLFCYTMLSSLIFFMRLFYLYQKKRVWRIQLKWNCDCGLWLSYRMYKRCILLFVLLVSWLERTKWTKIKKAADNLSWLVWAGFVQMFY